MKSVDYQSLFKEMFKFDLNQEVRHKGDMKSGFNNDLGLMVLSRHLQEECDDDGNVIYSRAYICRMIRFSGSGDLAKFSEKELLSIDEYNRIQLEEENKRTEMRSEMEQIRREVFESFGVKKDDEVFLFSNGKAFEVAYKVTGFQMKDGVTELIIRKVAGVGSDGAHVYVKDPKDFYMRKK